MLFYYSHTLCVALCVRCTVIKGASAPVVFKHVLIPCSYLCVLHEQFAATCVNAIHSCTGAAIFYFGCAGARTGCGGCAGAHTYGLVRQKTPLLHRNKRVIDVN